MKKIYVALVFILLSVSVFAQSAYKVTYKLLKEYEGMYEYENNSTLKIAASPKDTILYAIINQSRYVLKPFKKDVFLNGSKKEVAFFRNEKGKIAGYTLNKDTFSLITDKVTYPVTMWYPKIVPENTIYRYKYTVPKNSEDGIKTATINKPLSETLLTTMVNKIVEGDYPNVHSVLIIQHGKLVFEEYFYQYTKDSLHELRSASKSFVSALIGIALQKGYIKSKDEKVLSYFPEYKVDNNSDLKKKITIENLLTNQSGLDCDISNEASAGNETAMDYSEDWVKFTLDLPMSDVPGGKGMYCSGNPIMLGRIIEKTTATPLNDFAYKNLFKPLGIEYFKWNFNPVKANAEDFCQLYLTPRSMAKFGQMYLNKGKWEHRQIVPQNWITTSFTKHSEIQNVNYGYLWWLKYFDADDVRYNGIGAQGNGGQRIYLFPDQDIVIVITGGNYNSKSPSDELIANYILAGFNKR